MSRGMWRVTIDDAAFAANLRRLMPQLAADVKSEINKQADKFEAHLRANVPVDSGDLASTIVRATTSSGTKIEETITIGNDKAELYAAPLEFGHTLNGNHIEGKHFFFPLARFYNKKFRAAIKRVVRRAFRQFT